MRKIFILSLYLAVILNNAAFSQADSLKWSRLIKNHKNVEIIYDDYISKSWKIYNCTPQIFIDTIAVINASELDRLPLPAEGIDKFAASIIYPEITKRVLWEGGVVLSAFVDTAGNIKDVEVKYSSPKIFEYQASDDLKKTKFTPALKNGKPAEAQIIIAISFVLYKKQNPRIDSVSFRRSLCDFFCPAYKISFASNGDVIYEGRYFVDKIGKWKSKINESEFEGLISLIFATNFFSRKEEYRANIDGPPWITIEVATSEMTKSVSSNYFTPLWELAKFADLITKDLKWEKVGE